MLAPSVEPLLVPVADLQRDQDAGGDDHQVDQGPDPVVVAQAPGKSERHAAANAPVRVTRPPTPQSSFAMVPTACASPTVAPTTLPTLTTNVSFPSRTTSPLSVTANALLVAPAGIDCPASASAT